MFRLVEVFPMCFALVAERVVAMLMRKFLCVLTIAVVVCAAGAAQGAVLFSDDFSGSSSDNLNGATPDVTTGGATWAANTVMKADGSFTGSDSTAEALLAINGGLAIESGYIYTLQATLTTSSGQWTPLQFRSSTGGYCYEHSYSWALLKPTGAIECFGGSSTGNQFVTDSGTTSATSTIKIVLDTTDTAWTTTVYADNAELGSYTYATNPTIKYVGFGAYQATGKVANFSLDKSAVPEPSMFVMLSIVGGLLCYAWRKRK